jgi:RecB family exonuclease
MCWAPSIEGAERALTRAQAERLNGILRRHVRAEDQYRSDHELVHAAVGRYAQERDAALIDPNE